MATERDELAVFRDLLHRCDVSSSWMPTIFGYTCPPWIRALAGEIADAAVARFTWVAVNMGDTDGAIYLYHKRKMDRYSPKARIFPNEDKTLVVRFDTVNKEKSFELRHAEMKEGKRGEIMQQVLDSLQEGHWDRAPDPWVMALAERIADEGAKLYALTKAPGETDGCWVLKGAKGHVVATIDADHEARAQFAAFSTSVQATGDDAWKFEEKSWKRGHSKMKEADSDSIRAEVLEVLKGCNYAKGADPWIFTFAEETANTIASHAKWEGEWAAAPDKESAGDYKVSRGSRWKVSVEPDGAGVFKVVDVHISRERMTLWSRPHALMQEAKKAEYAAAILKVILDGFKKPSTYKPRPQRNNDDARNNTNQREDYSHLVVEENITRQRWSERHGD